MKRILVLLAVLLVTSFVGCATTERKSSTEAELEKLRAMKIHNLIPNNEYKRLKEMLEEGDQED